MKRRGALADVVLALLLGAAAYAAVFAASDWKREQYWWAARDVWFDADSDRVFFVEAIHTWGYNRVAIHPLHAYLARPPVVAARRLFGWTDDLAVRHFHAGIAALWVGFFFGLLRRFQCRRGDALLFTGVAASSAACAFWMPAIETFSLGSLTLFPALSLAAGAPSASLPAHIAAGVAAFGVTVTNGMVAFFTWLVTLRRRAVVIAGLATFSIIAVLAYFHPWVFWGSSPMPENRTNELAWVFSPESGGARAVVRTFFFGSMVAPEIRMLPNWRHPAWPLMTFQYGELFSATRWGWVATIAWSGLLAAGGAALFKLKDEQRLRTVLGLSILYQLLLHLAYGRETFLYSMHYLPLLVIPAALATRTAYRRLVLALAFVLLCANAPNTIRQFAWAQAYTRRGGTLKRLRPDVGLWSFDSTVEADPSDGFRFWRRSGR